MADAVASLTKIVDVALKIKKVVDTVRQNRKDCHHIRSRVERVRHTLSLCEGNTELMESPAVCATVEALGEVLGEALELVTGCQEETTAANAVCLCCTAGKLSKQLSKVDRAISDVNSEATFAILVYHISRQTRDGARPVPPAEIIEVLAPPHRRLCRHPCSVDGLLQQSQRITMWEYSTGCGTIGSAHQDTGPKVMQICNHQIRTKRIPFYSHLACTLEAKSWPWKTRRRKSAGPASDHVTAGLTLLHQIAGVALNIEVAAETVLLRNKDDCKEIGRRASRISMLLSRLEDTETTKDAAGRAALEKILETFWRAHAAVVACQRRTIVVFLCYSHFQTGKLSNELCGVLDQMVLDVDALIDILPSVHIVRNRAI